MSPRGRRAAKKRDELAPFQLFEWDSRKQAVNLRRPSVNHVNRIFHDARLANPRAVAPRSAFFAGEDPRD
jgi:hypothetical protein